jgi:hypothetical protein
MAGESGSSHARATRCGETPCAAISDSAGLLPNCPARSRLRGYDIPPACGGSFPAVGDNAAVLRITGFAERELLLGYTWAESPSGMTGFQDCWLSLWQLYMLKKTPDKQAAWQWMQEFTSPKYDTSNFKQFGVDLMYQSTCGNKEWIRELLCRREIQSVQDQDPL